jgi:hypothetical protein
VIRYVLQAIAQARMVADEDESHLGVVGSHIENVDHHRHVAEDGVPARWNRAQHNSEARSGQ